MADMKAKYPVKEINAEKLIEIGFRGATPEDANSLDGKKLVFNWTYRFKNSGNNNRTIVLTDRKTNKPLGAYEFSVDNGVFYIDYIENFFKNEINNVGTNLAIDAVKKKFKEGCKKVVAFARCQKDSKRNTYEFFEKLGFEQEKDYGIEDTDADTYIIRVSLSRESAIRLLDGKDKTLIEC